ncbi:MAG: tyrosine-type recombinase/integrase [Pseudomonadales bacterium]|nr:tyrosine-type recombinase/integrase [Pseudomonadales bacterium]
MPQKPDNRYYKTRIPGIRIRNGKYHLRCQYLGQKIHGATGIPVKGGRLKDAETILNTRKAEIRNLKLLGITPQITFAEAGTEYIVRHQHFDQINNFAGICARISDHYLGTVAVEDIHQDHPNIQKLIIDLVDGTVPWEYGNGHSGKTRPRKKRTVQRHLNVILTVLRFCADSWRDPVTHQYYLNRIPTFKLDHLRDDKSPAIAMTWAQQRNMEEYLAPHLQRMMIYDVNSGLRDRELTMLRWKWETDVQVPGIQSVFVLPGYCSVLDKNGESQELKVTKNGKPRVSMINSICRSILDEQRGKHPDFVFTFDGNPITRVLNSGWKKAREKASKNDPVLAKLRFHDCRHTFGHRLEAAGVDERTRETLLGHRTKSVTDHYSQQDLIHLQQAVEQITKETGSVPVLSLVRDV